MEILWLLKVVFHKYGFPKDIVNLIIRSYCIPAIARHVLEEAGYIV